MTPMIVQNRAVVKEYIEAIEDGQHSLAARIRDANPDLKTAFEAAIDQRRPIVARESRRRGGWLGAGN